MTGILDPVTVAMFPSPLLALPGAVAAEGRDAGIAQHYGDPHGEQRRLADAVGWIDRSNRDVLIVPGTDRLSWLHSLTSQHLAELADGRGTEALVLSPHGHVEHHLLVAETGGVTWLDVEPGTGPDLLKFLDSMRFLLRVDPSDVSEQWAVLSLVGPDTPDVLTALGVRAPAAYDVAPLAGGWVRRMPWPGAAAADVLVPRSELAEFAERLARAGATPAGIWAFEALRVEARRPRLRNESDHRTIPHEVGWLESAVHLNKGCYRGQETVARVHNLGRPPRRLVLLHLDGSLESLPATGAAVTLDGRQVGFVTTAVRHYELGPVALALVKRKTADDAVLHVGDVAAAIDA